MKDTRRLLVLYSELMPYNIAVFHNLVDKYDDVEIDVVCWSDHKKLTPFVPNALAGVTIYYLDKINLDYHKKKKYHCLYVVGRMEKVYLNLSKHFRILNVPVVMVTDEQLVFSFRQVVKKVFSRLLYHQYFSHCMVPGFKQYEMARWLGFDCDKIFKSSLVCSVRKNNELYKTQGRVFKDKFVICFIGRFAPEKGLLQLISAIEHLNSSGYEIILRCIGQGVMSKFMESKPFVEVIDFCSPEDYFRLTRDVRFLVLPSLYEPWGVVVQEAMSIGLPVICSENVGSGVDFVKHRVNGLIFSHRSKYGLLSVLKDAYSITEMQWMEMSQSAQRVSSYHTESNWSTVINSLMNEKSNY